MKVLVVGRTLPDKATGMFGTFELHQAKALKKYGHKVVYGFVDNRSIKIHRKIGTLNKCVDGVEIFGTFVPSGGIPKKAYDHLKTFLFLRLWKKIVTKFGFPDVVHVHFPIINLNEKIIEFLASQQVVLVATEHWSKVLQKELTRRELRILCKLSENFDCIISVSEELKIAIDETLQNNGKVKDICVVPNMVNDNLQYIPRLGDNNFSLAVIGRLSIEKRLDAIIYAFSHVHSRFKKARLHIIGEGADYKRLSKLVNDLNLNGDVVFTGYLTHDELMKYFKNVDVTVNATVRETFGVPAVESWYLGRPTILPDHHPMARNVNWDNGIIYDNSNDQKELIENIVAAIFESINRKFNYRALARNTKDSYSEYSVSQKLSEIYEEHQRKRHGNLDV